MIEIPHLEHYRPNVGVCLFNRDGKVWVGKRRVPARLKNQYTHRWQMPQGGIDRGEQAHEAVFRELYEETGVRNAFLLSLTPGWLAYDFPSDHRAREKDRWRGQKQKWALMRFDGEDSEVNLTAHDEQEFSDWRWVSLEELPDLVVPFKRPVYEELISSFAPLIRHLTNTGVS